MFKYHTRPQDQGYTISLSSLSHTMEGKRLPKYLLASVLISNGGLLNGLDTGSIGAITNMAQFAESIGELSPFLLGFTVSLIMLTGSVPSIMAGHLADKFGRLKTILLGAILFGIGVILQGAAGTLAQFLVGRAVAGLGEGVYLTNVSVYITEISFIWVLIAIIDA